ncbi:Ff.00g060660.m01.CDS01 [Fusarium sp. VM40]|nr:Ff.00g060660.m01.CDS01 [Fusarium sp. VM40]
MEKKTLGLIIGISALSVVGGALTIYHCCIKKKPDDGHSPFYPGTPTPGTPAGSTSASPRPSLTVLEPKPWEPKSCEPVA